jgi:hypothetical protein
VESDPDPHKELQMASNQKTIDWKEYEKRFEAVEAEAAEEASRFLPLLDIHPAADLFDLFELPEHEES